MKRSFVLLLCLLVPTLCALGQIVRANPPAPDQLAPPLAYSKEDLFQAPQGSRAGWDPIPDGHSLSGKVVVLAFWSMWYTPSFAEIPALNRLANSLDQGKVQFISNVQEDPAQVQTLLREYPVSGWVITDPDRTNFKRWSVGAPLTVFVIDTKGNIVWMTLHPERLLPNALLQLAEDKSVALENESDAKADGETWSAVRDAMTTQAQLDSRVEPLFSVSITQGNPSVEGTGGGGIARGGHNWNAISVTDMTPDRLLIFSLGLRAGRVKINGVLPKTRYTLSVRAPSLDSPLVTVAVESAIASTCGVRIERHTSMQDVYLLKATDKAQYRPHQFPIDLGGHYKYDNYTINRTYDITTISPLRLNLDRASMNDMADGLEEVLNRPVVNESGVSGEVTANLSFAAPNFELVKAALEQSTGFTLVPAKRPIETFTITPDSEIQKATAGSIH